METLDIDRGLFDSLCLNNLEKRIPRGVGKTSPVLIFFYSAPSRLQEFWVLMESRISLGSVLGA